MKFLLALLPFAVAGCHTAAPLPTKPAPAPALPVPPAWTAAVTPPVVTPPASHLEQRLRQQTQIIEALVSQNDALIAKLESAPAVPAPSPTVSISAPIVPPAPPPPVAVAPDVAPTSQPVTKKADEALLLPNADGVIDLTVRPATDSDTPINPFVVRTAAPGTAREITLHVGGIIAGPVACAVINDRLVQAGDNIESLAIERIEPNAVFIRHEGRRLRLPVSTRSVRVLLPL